MSHHTKKWQLFNVMKAAANTVADLGCTCVKWIFLQSTKSCMKIQFITMIKTDVELTIGCFIS